MFLNRIKVSLWYLRNNFSMDILEEDMAEYVSISLIVFSKLPGDLKRELMQLKLSYIKHNGVITLLKLCGK